MIDFQAMQQDAQHRVDSRKPCATVDQIIVDANNLLYRLAHIEKHDPKAVALVFIEKILMLADWYGSGVSNCNIVWEGDSKNNWRFKEHPEYKATRKKNGDPSLRSCVRESESILRDALSYTAFPQWDPKGAEGDDGFATLAKLHNRCGLRVGIYSTDRDLLQLANENTVLIVPQRGASDIAMTEDDVLKAYGVTVSQLLDVKALEGDMGDNIPGVKGIGRKYAVELIQKNQNYDNLWIDIDGLEKLEAETQKAWKERLKARGLTPSRLERLKAGKQSGDMSYIVGAIRDDIQLDLTKTKVTSERRFFEDFDFLKRSRYLGDNAKGFLLI